MQWPSIGVVVPTRDRPRILRRALDAIHAQHYPGPVRVLVVFDQTPPDGLLARGGDRPVTVLANARGVGLAGARNTGIVVLDTELVAFCDDEDEWLPGKLSAQVEALSATPAADLVTCAAEVVHRDHAVPQFIGDTHLRLDRLVAPETVLPRSSSFLIRRSSLLGPDGFGLLAEDAPGSRNEDWDLLLRATRRAPVEHVDEPLVRVPWRGPVHHGYEYATRIASLRWMMSRHPEIGGCPPGGARTSPAPRWPARNRQDAWKYSRAAARDNWREPRDLAELARLSRIDSLLGAMNKRDRAG
jgi:glycosyltransferase involved in cell wall biosynthesis